MSNGESPDLAFTLDQALARKSKEEAENTRRRIVSAAAEFREWGIGGSLRLPFRTG
jgi:hypothetical protein